jgi:hypothetical protein
MARIKYTALVESIRGSIAGTTFQGNAYGYSVKSKPRIVKPNTPRQVRRKQRFQSLSKSWGSLTSGERQNWRDYAQLFPIPSKYNPASNLNGFNYFMKYHILSWMAGSGVILGDPGNSQFDFLFDQSSLVIDGVDFYIVVEFESDAPTADLRGIALLTPVIPQSRSSARYTPRFIGDALSDGSPSASFTIDAASDYSNVYGYVPDVGDNIVMDFWVIGRFTGQIVKLPTTLYTVV